GEVDGAVVDTAVLDSYRADKPGAARRLRSLIVSEPFPSGVVAYHADRLSDTEVRGFRSGLLGARNTPQRRSALRLLRLTSSHAPPADPDDALKATARPCPPPAPGPNVAASLQLAGETRRQVANLPPREPPGRGKAPPGRLVPFPPGLD